MNPTPAPFGTINDAIGDIAAGRMVIVVDDPERENEGDLCMAAPLVTPEAVNFMAKHARGLICLPLPPDRCDALDLPPMVNVHAHDHGAAFTVSIDARDGVASGISAADRAQTIRTAAAITAAPDDLLRPGHIFPLRARPGGVRERAGHTEAAVDLVRLAGVAPAAAVICEVLNDDGTVARLRDLTQFARRHALRIITISDLIAHVEACWPARTFANSLVTP
jgi:3,4-dihydroxy 2-butanone 4-phosphate synthase / GTP cyclohydrolase II